jgi:hypothetical protein
MIIHRLRARQIRPRIKEQWQYAAFVFGLTLFLSMSSNWFMRMNTFMLGLPTVPRWGDCDQLPTVRFGAQRRSDRDQLRTDDSAASAQ